MYSLHSVHDLNILAFRPCAMQGFNRYIPPDYDPKKNSTLNSHQGKKHALGARAKDIDKGVLVVRFELPFNIWCESCGVSGAEHYA
jgi:hypothetical protein